MVLISVSSPPSSSEFNECIMYLIGTIEPLKLYFVHVMFLHPLFVFSDAEEMDFIIKNCVCRQLSRGLV